MAKEIPLYVLFIISPLILVLIILKGSKMWRWINSIKATLDRRYLKKVKEEPWDRAMKEMKAIEKENFEALGNIKIFLSDPNLKDGYLKEVVVPEFNLNAPSEEYLPLNLSEKKLRRAILEKAQEYYATSNPLLEILAESFVAQMRRGLEKNH